MQYQEFKRTFTKTYVCNKENVNVTLTITDEKTYFSCPLSKTCKHWCPFGIKKNKRNIKVKCPYCGFINKIYYDTNLVTCRNCKKQFKVIFK